MSEERAMTKGETAAGNFKDGYNCAQAVVLAFADELGLTREAAARLASSFGGGMGRMREVCGAVSGMLLVAGGLLGYDDPTAGEEKTEHYALVQRLAGEFRERNGSIVCRELLGLAQKTDAPVPEARTAAYYKKRPCAEYCRDCAEILERLLAERAHE